MRLAAGLLLSFPFRSANGKWKNLSLSLSLPFSFTDLRRWLLKCPSRGRRMEEASKLLPGPNSTLLQHKSHQRRRRLRILSQSRSRISPPPPPFLVGDGGKNRGRRLTRIEATGRGERRRTSTAILLCFFRLSGPSPFFLPLMVYLPICLVLFPREGKEVAAHSPSPFPFSCWRRHKGSINVRRGGGRRGGQKGDFPFSLLRRGEGIG